MCKTIHRLAELPPADYIILAPEETTSNLYSQPHLLIHIDLYEYSFFQIQLLNAGKITRSYC